MDIPMNRALLRVRSSGIRRFTALAKRTPGCVMLSLGEPDRCTPSAVKEAAKAALDADRTHYPPNNGEPFLLKAISQWEAERYGLSYSPEEIIATCGATEAIYVALTGILNPGDEVIIPSPAFCLYEEIVRLAGGVCRFLDTTQTDFELSPDALLSLIGERTKAIILTSPHNPTGCVYRQSTLEAVRSIVAGKPIFVLCDDVYQQLVYTPNYRSFAQFHDLKHQILLVKSFSKPYAMTGWRAGYLMADAPVKAQLEKLHQYAVVSMASFIQPACVRALGEDVSPVRELYRHRRDFVLARLREMGLCCRTPEGAFYVFPSIRRFGLSSETFCTRLIEEAGVALVPGTCFGAEGYVRLSYCCDEEVLSLGLDRLECFLKKIT